MRKHTFASRSRESPGPDEPAWLGATTGRGTPDRLGDSPDAKQARADMGADHGPDLGDERLAATHDLLGRLSEPPSFLGGLDVLHDPRVGAVGVALLRV